MVYKRIVRELRKAVGGETGRNMAGVGAGCVGIVLNLLLFAGKLVAGNLSGSVAISADAFNNLSDAGSSLITVLGFTLSARRPDTGHPFGHGRLEYIAGLIVALMILLVGVELFQASLQKITTPEPVVFGAVSVAVLVASVVVKLCMAWYNRRVGRRIGSAALEAARMDSLSDAVATGLVLAVMLAQRFTGVRLDGWCGLAVSVMIFAAGVKAARGTIDPLLGQAPGAAFLAETEGIVRACPDVIGVHDLIVHDYGPGRRVITLHAEVPASGDILALHDAIDNIEKELYARLGCAAVIHMDPIVTDDALTNQTRTRVQEVVKGLDERVTVHDFRMVSGPTHTNVIFDVVVPFDVKLAEKEIKRRVAHMVRALDGNFYAVVAVDRGASAIEKE